MRTTGEALLVMIHDSLLRGHNRVAAQRYLMLKSQGHAVPEGVRSTCERTVESLPARERTRMEAAARAWGETWRNLRRLSST